MLTKDEAVAYAKKHLVDIEKECGIKLAFAENSPVEVKYGYAFAYNSAQFLASHNFRDALVGNAPFLVDIYG